MKKVISLVLVLSVVMALTVTPTLAAKETFGTALQYLGLIQGDNKGNLNEDKYISRVEFITIIMRMTDASNVNIPTKASFTDIPTNHWAFKIVEQAKALAITNGVGNNKFGEKDDITYEQALALLMRNMGFLFNYEDTMSKAIRTGLELQFIKAGNQKLKRSEVFELVATSLLTHVPGTVPTTAIAENEMIDQAKVEEFRKRYYVAYNNFYPVNERLVLTYDDFEFNEARVKTAEEVPTEGDFWLRAREVDDIYINNKIEAEKFIGEMEFVKYNTPMFFYSSMSNPEGQASKFVFESLRLTEYGPNQCDGATVRLKSDFTMSAHIYSNFGQGDLYIDNIECFVGTHFETDSGNVLPFIIRGDQYYGTADDPYEPEDQEIKKFQGVFLYNFTTYEIVYGYVNTYYGDGPVFGASSR